MDVNETPVTRGSPDGNVVNDAGTAKDPDLTVLEEEEKENEFVVERSGSFNPVDDETDTLPTDVHMEESEPISQEPVDVVTGTNAATENIAAIDGKPELLRIETADDHVKTEGEVHENVDQGITTLNAEAQNRDHSNKWLTDTQIGAADVSGTIEEQAAFMKELERFHIERALDFKPTKFYGEPLNCLKLWRSVIMLGGYDHVTTNKYWRQIGESFRPPKTCTTISWTFRNFYEKALLEYERHEIQAGLHMSIPCRCKRLLIKSLPVGILYGKTLEVWNNFYGSLAGQAVGSHKARRDSSSRAVKGQCSGEDLSLTLKRDKNLKSIGSGEHKNATNHGRTDKDGHPEADRRMVTTVIDVGPPVDWVKVSVQENKDCFEIYALVPGLLREELDPAGRLVITGQPEQLENPWGITPFKKVVNLPVRIDPRQTSAVVSLHGRLYVQDESRRDAADPSSKTLEA